MYVSKERVIRDGYLIAYEGEEMSDEEAKARGLLAGNSKASAKRTSRKKSEPKGDASDAPETAEDTENEEPEQ